MARRYKRRIAFQGGPNIWPSEEASLPLEHESVRRLEELIFDAPRVVLPLGGMGGTPMSARRRQRIWMAAGRVSKPQFMLSGSSLRQARHLAKRQDLLAFRKLPSLGVRTARCVGRVVRKQIMFALGKAGRMGIGRGKRWRRTRWSLYPC